MNLAQLPCSVHLLDGVIRDRLIYRLGFSLFLVSSKMMRPTAHTVIEYGLGWEKIQQEVSPLSLYCVKAHQLLLCFEGATYLGIVSCRSRHFVSTQLESSHLMGQNFFYIIHTSSYRIRWMSSKKPVSTNSRALTRCSWGKYSSQKCTTAKTVI